MGCWEASPGAWLRKGSWGAAQVDSSRAEGSVNLSQMRQSLTGRERGSQCPQRPLVKCVCVCARTTCIAWGVAGEREPSQSAFFPGAKSAEMVSGHTYDCTSSQGSWRRWNETLPQWVPQSFQ